MTLKLEKTRSWKEKKLSSVFSPFETIIYIPPCIFLYIFSSEVDIRVFCSSYFATHTLYQVDDNIFSNKIFFFLLLLVEHEQKGVYRLEK